jgi:hypothetical protein
MISTTPNRNWDDLDVFYLANVFTADQLKNEIDSTKRHFPYEDWHADYIECCQKAISWIRNCRPLPAYKDGSKFVDIKVLKSAVDILSIAERYTRLARSGRNYHGLCPFHSEKKPSFMVYPDKQTWHCFGACNAGGDVISLVMKGEHVDFKGAIAILRGDR